MSISQSSELNYTSGVAQHSQPRMSRVLPLNGVSGLPLQTGSTSEVLFELPNKAYNLAHSSLDFKVQVPAPAAGKANCLHSVGLTAIDRISLYTREGAYLVDMVNCAEYTRAMNPYETKMSEFLDNDSSVGGNSIASASQSDKGFNNFRCDGRASDVVTPNGSCALRVQTGGANYEGNDINFTSPQSLAVGAIDDELTVSYSVPLRAVQNSLLSVDRVMYFGQSLLLRVHFNASDRIGFEATGLPAIGAIAAPTALTGAVALSDIRVYLSVETNPTVIQGLVNRVQSQGLQVITPYVYSYRFNSGATSSVSISQRLNAGHGQRLLHAVYAPFNNVASGVTAYDMANTGASKVVSFQSMMDNNLLQEFVPRALELEDYEMSRKMLPGCLVQNAKEFQWNYTHVDSFRKGPSCDWRESDTTIDGLDLTSERIWNIDVTTAGNALRNFTWFCVQRTLNINANGIITIS